MNIDALRKSMGTNPKESVDLYTQFFEGVRNIDVFLIDFPTNPYRSIVNMATSTWGNKIDKWSTMTADNRFFVVKKGVEY